MNKRRMGPVKAGKAHPHIPNSARSLAEWLRLMEASHPDPLSPSPAHALAAWLMNASPSPDAHAPGAAYSLADVALIDVAGITEAACISKSTWHDLVRRGEAPRPVLRAPRCTRWRVADVREWLRQRAERGSDPEAEAAVLRAAQAGTEAAQAKRRRTRGE